VPEPRLDLPWRLSTEADEVGRGALPVFPPMGFLVPPPALAVRLSPQRALPEFRLGILVFIP
jgi:hypothetical protein